jgi:tetratricopeptide (TPR) repeat protein
MLARIYMEDKQYQQALKYLTQAARDPMPVPEHLALLSKVQILLGYTANAASTVKQLKAVAPASWEAASEEARLLARTGDKTGAARRLLGTNMARTPGEITGRIAPFLEEIGCTEAAEKALADELAKSPGPTAHVPLTTFYLRTGHFERAAATARKYDGPKTPPGLTARLLSAAVYARPRSREDADGSWARTVAEIQKIIAEKDKTSPNNVDVLYAKAELADAAGKFDEALSLYERCLDLKKDGDVYLNNAAVMLALLKKDAGDRPVKLADRVIAIRGPRPEFLDTRGLCDLAAGNTKKAVEDFTLATRFDPKAVYFYHLSVAQDRAQYPLLSYAALTEAEKRGLNAKTYKDQLHPLEWPVYEALTKKRKK